jgi:hypothetical protein
MARFSGLGLLAKFLEISPLEKEERLPELSSSLLELNKIK